MKLGVGRKGGWAGILYLLQQQLGPVSVLGLAPSKELACVQRGALWFGRFLEEKGDVYLFTSKASHSMHTSPLPVDTAHVFFGMAAPAGVGRIGSGH